MEMKKNHSDKTAQNGIKWRELNQDQKDRLVAIMKDLFTTEAAKKGRALYDPEKRRLMRMLGGELRKQQVPIHLRGVYLPLWNRITRWNGKCYLDYLRKSISSSSAEKEKPHNLSSWNPQ